VLRPYVKEIHWLILKHLLEDHGSARTLSIMEVLTSTIFSVPFHLATAVCPTHALSHGLALLNPAVGLSYHAKLTGMCSPHKGCPLNAWLWWPGSIAFLGPT